MKLLNYFYYALACVAFMSILTACEKENQLEEEIPVTIKSDFTARYPLAQIKTFKNYSDGQSQLDFIDNEQNEASIWYVNETWKMTHTRISNFEHLPLKAQSTFKNSEYGNAQIIDIYKTEREGIDKALYTLHFQYQWKKTANVEHYVFINDDGLYLSTFTWTPNDPRWFVTLPKDHFDFIAKKYSGAEIRGYINNSGEHEYIILHEDTIKYVFFGGEVANDRMFWKETRYELSKDAIIPDNVSKVLKQNNPDFTYTNIYYIESDQGNAYLFIDKNHDQELGYYIGENSKP
ncbi:MAG: PepSY-like domain-containing protein [Porphyromonadaceae bacterium]|nr:PepSY-like domain-containing protein [Porphyromonadaceae bacterium]